MGDSYKHTLLGIGVFCLLTRHSNEVKTKLIKIKGSTELFYFFMGRILCSHIYYKFQS